MSRINLCPSYSDWEFRLYLSEPLTQSADFSLSYGRRIILKVFASVAWRDDRWEAAMGGIAGIIVTRFHAARSSRNWVSWLAHRRKTRWIRKLKIGRAAHFIYVLCVFCINYEKCVENSITIIFLSNFIIFAIFMQIALSNMYFQC